MHTHNVWAWTAIALSSLSISMAFRGPIRKWYKKIRRRRGGVYLWRVDHHLNRMRRVNGYVGETVSFYLRGRQHMGVSRFDPVTGLVARNGPVKVPAQPWSDLRPVCHQVIKLPWWLCWKWVLRPLETLVMVCTWPVYNDAKNHWNPRRIPKTVAKAQRASRDAGWNWRMGARAAGAHAVRYLVQAVAAVVILGVVALGTYGWLVTT
jgi:hypothetical protein